MSRILLAPTIALLLLPVAPHASAKTPKTTSKGSAVEISTSLGKIVVQLFPQKAPKTVANFLRYVRSRHYDGTIFHRVIPNFMIQGGGMTASMVKKPTAKAIANEADNGLKNTRGTLAMARTSDPHSATAQFFINVQDNAFLDFKSKTPRGWGYCVFGKVKKGMGVVDKIRKVATTTRHGRANVPVKTVLIKTVRVLP